MSQITMSIDVGLIEIYLHAALQSSMADLIHGKSIDRAVENASSAEMAAAIQTP